MVFYLLAATPFKDRLMEKSLIVGELCVISFYLVFSMPFISTIDLSSSRQGSICILIVVTNIAFNVFLNTISSGITIYNWVKNRKFAKIIPEENPAKIKQTECGNTFTSPTERRNQDLGNLTVEVKY